jgi:HEAT repeat protein
LIQSNRAGLRQLACRLVAHLDLNDELINMTPLLCDPVPDIRIEALNTFALLGRPVPPAEMEQRLQDPCPEVAITAAWADLRQGGSGGRLVLEKWIDSSQPEWRRLASAALSIAGPKAVSIMLSRIKASTDPFVRINLAMGLIGQRAHVPLACEQLYTALMEQKTELWMWDQRANPLMRSLSPSRLHHIEEIPHYPYVIDQLVRLDLLTVLSMMGHPKAQTAVKTFLRNETWGVTGAAAATLLEEGDEQALEQVRGLLTDKEEKVRVQAALILAFLGNDPEAAKVLHEAYSTVDREMKVQILEALAQVGDPKSLPFLIDVLKEPFQLLRVVAASALIQSLHH